MTNTTTKFISTSTLAIAYEESGKPNDIPVILMHGFPDDVRTYDAVVKDLITKGFRTIVPYLRGYGQTQFLKSSSMRSGQQAALGNDLKELMDALNIPKAFLVGYDWGGRAACIVSALWPERVAGLVTVTGYNIQHIPTMCEPALPQQEYLYWYMWYFATERGRLGLAKYRKELCRKLWKDWSPNWDMSDDEYARTAASFDNPDFVDVVIHSYRHRFAQAVGDPALDGIEKQLLQSPIITVPTVILESACDGLDVPGQQQADDTAQFSQLIARRTIPIVGHFLPRENPGSIVQALLELPN